MEKKCLNCEEYFTAKRESRKYCSDNCKQMAYFKRNGLILSGVALKENEETEPADPIIGNDEFKDQEENVKYDSKIPFEGKTLDEFVNRLTSVIDQRVNTAISNVKQELTVKYDSLNVKSHFTENNIGTNELYGSEQVAEPGEYKWVESKFHKCIEKNVLEGEGHKLSNPHKYWGYEQEKIINWVNIRFRCLMESLIKLSNNPHIDRNTLFCLTNAFNRLVRSNTFKNLPDNYPYNDLIKELCIKLNQMSRVNANTEKVKIQLSPEKKAKLLSIRHGMTQLPAMKFSEINFDEEIQKPKPINNEEKDEKKKTNYYAKLDWRTRKRRLKMQELLKAA